MASIAEQIAAARKAKGMTQDALASAMHMSRQGISHWETGRTLPDAEALLRLSSLLNYQFEIPEENAPGDNAPADPAGPTTARQEEAAEAKANNRPAYKKLFLCAAAVIVLLAACLIIIPRLNGQQKKGVFISAGGTRYTIADYQAVTPRKEGKAYLSVTPRLEIRNPGENTFYFYSFILREENGIPFTIQRSECVQFFENSAGADIYSGEELKAFELDPELPALGTFEYSGGQPAFTPNKKRNGLGVGYRVDGVDGNGNSMTFTGYLPLPQD
ncbi:MAG: helix-turn-helix transcriptional regulator [Clostridia bacterium]|nr:helix-turn-helix transcriptional regulator [Clostridia bacterium]